MSGGRPVVAIATSVIEALRRWVTGGTTSIRVDVVDVSAADEVGFVPTRPTTSGLGNGGVTVVTTDVVRQAHVSTSIEVEAVRRGTIRVRGRGPVITGAAGVDQVKSTRGDVHAADGRKR